MRNVTNRNTFQYWKNLYTFRNIRKVTST